MSCEEIFDILNSEAREEQALKAHKKRLESLNADILGQIVKIEKMLDKSDGQKYDPCIRQIDEYTVFCARSYIQDINRIRDFVLACVEELHRTNPKVQFSLPDYCCVIYPGDSYREEKVFVENGNSITCKD